jgi:thiamine kinase
MSVASFEPLKFLARHGLADVRGLTVESLSGGYQNQVYRVRDDELDWVIKRFSPASEITLFPNLADAEAMALRRLAVCGAAPRPIAFITDAEDAPVLVYEFYVGRPWSGRIASVAELLRRIARVDAAGFRPVPMTTPDILAQGDAFVVECAANVQLRLISARPQPTETEPGPRRLIHTDFGPGNLIEGAEGLKAIDWQCPAAGDPAEDLAAFLSPAFQILYGRAPLTNAEEDALLEAYDEAETIARLRQLRPFFDWRMAAYCAMRQAYWAVGRPEASERYRRSIEALLGRLGG